jgi:DNA-binding NarL/FixJ family response regulator
MIKLLIADDHQMFIDGIRSLLSDQGAYLITGEAHNGQEVLDHVAMIEPDIVLLDVNMPVMDGLTVLKVLKEKHPGVKVIMLTMFDTKDYVQRLLKAGADGYILKNTGKAELNRGIETVMKGQSFFSNEVTQLVMEDLQGKKSKSNTVKVELTQRETEVLKLIVKEHTTQEIADTLFISTNTVETHRKNLISKLGVRNLAGLVKYALQNGLAD